MATIEKFEDMEVWRLAREQAQSFFALCSGSLRSDFELRNQMNASSGSVMDCIAEGFERSGRSELKNFLVMAKGSNGEYNHNFTGQQTGIISATKCSQSFV